MSREFERMEQGYVMGWLAGELHVEPFTARRSTDDQLMFEKYMRECVADQRIFNREELEALWNSPMEYLVNHKNWFVDFSDFYHLPKKVELNARTILFSEGAVKVRAVLWTYAAVQVYVNEQCVVQNDIPVYKPIGMYPFTLELKQGENRVFVRMQNLGVRDTRNIFGIQLLEERDNVHVRIPEVEGINRMLDAERYLDTIQYQNGELCFGEPFSEDIVLKELGRTVNGGFTGKVKAEGCTRLTLAVTVLNQEITRTIEFADRIRPEYLDEETDAKDDRKAFFAYIGRIDPASSHEASRFSIYPLLARYGAGERHEEDDCILLQQLELLDSRIDCADFIANGFLRFMNCYELSEAVEKRAREVLLNFRYWMNEDGEDGMCFWSENHSILFYSALLLASKQYPEDIFIRSGRTGGEQYDEARTKVFGWLAETERWGFEEFLSGGYTVVTVAALLNLVDFAEEDISRRASWTIDRILLTLAKHTYKGSVIAPEGRIYRDVIYPFMQGTQALVHYMNPRYPVSDNIWLACFATTKYKVPENLTELMENPCYEEYGTGNARITLNKKQDYILTSAASPREDSFMPWQNNSFDSDADRNSVCYTRSINERFHGTTYFQPGVYGYQQHLWYAALDSECVVFVNHPGENTDRSSMRPAYWYGNGVFPAVKQNGNCLGVVYQIPEQHPIHFTHLFFPEGRFDEVRKEDNWIFARKGEGYLAVWSDRSLVAYDDLLAGCEYRSYGSRSAYVCICGSREEDHTFDEFTDRNRKLDIRFLEHEMELYAGDKVYIKFEEHQNRTQYI